MKSIKPLIVILLIILSINVKANEAFSIDCDDYLIDEDVYINGDCLITINDNVFINYSFIVGENVNVVVDNDYRLEYKGEDSLFILNEGSSLTINNGEYISSSISIVKGYKDSLLTINDGTYIKSLNTSDTPMFEVDKVILNGGSFISEEYTGVCINAKEVNHNEGNLENFSIGIKANNINIKSDVSYDSLSDIYLYEDGLINFDDTYNVYTQIQIDDHKNIHYKDKRPITSNTDNIDLLDYLSSSYAFLDIGYDTYYYMYKHTDNLEYEVIDNAIIAKDNEDVPLESKETLLLSIDAKDINYSDDVYDGLVINDTLTDITNDKYIVIYKDDKDKEVIPKDIGEYTVYLTLNHDYIDYTISDSFSILEAKPVYKEEHPTNKPITNRCIVVNTSVR